ncbi:MAG: nuclear transport factor 2 family protein [Chitinophagaceae bacterium]
MTNKTEVIKQFFHLLQWFTTSEQEYKALLHTGIEQIQYPNLMIPATRKRTFTNLIEGAEAGKKMLAYQHFAPVHFFETGDAVIAEYTWTGELKVKVGRLKQGQVLKAHICTIFEFRDGKIYRQRNYDCYEPVIVAGRK